MKKTKKKNCEHRYICTLDCSRLYVKLQCKYCNEISEREGDADYFQYMVWLTNREEIKKFFADPDNKFKTWYPTLGTV